MTQFGSYVQRSAVRDSVPFNVNIWDVYMDCDHNVTVTAGLVRDVISQSSLFPLAHMSGDSVNGSLEVPSWRNGKRAQLPAATGARYMGMGGAWPSTGVTSYSYCSAFEVNNAGTWHSPFALGTNQGGKGLFFTHADASTSFFQEFVGAAGQYLPLSPIATHGAAAVFGSIKTGASSQWWYKESGQPMQTGSLTGLGVTIPGTAVHWGCGHSGFSQGRIDFWDRPIGSLAFSARAMTVSDMLATIAYKQEYYAIP